MKHRRPPPFIAQPDSLIGQPCSAYQVQATFDWNSRAALDALQDDVERRGPAGLFQIPSSSLHVTVLPLVDVAEDTLIPKDELWRRHSGDWLAALDRASRSLVSAELCFAELRYTDRAIILVADEPNPISDLRPEIVRGLEASARRLRVPDITHTTLFRYLREIQIRPPKPSRLSLRVRVASIRLVHERFYPSLDVTTLWDRRLECRDRETPG